MKITGHAKDRMRQMGLTLDDVMPIVRQPDMTWQDPKYRNRRRLFGTLVVAIVEHRPDPHADRLITVLWRSDNERFVRPDE